MLSLSALVLLSVLHFELHGDVLLLAVLYSVYAAAF